MLGGVNNNSCFRVKNIYNNIFIWHKNGSLLLRKLSLVAYDKNSRGAMIWLSSYFNNNTNIKERSTYNVDHVIIVFKI
jgi:hypothetical protein